MVIALTTSWRRSPISIGSLAAKLGIPEHGLRRLINRRLGYRNFNAFLNGYRLDDVMAALADLDRKSRGQARHPRTRPAPTDQPASRVSQLQRLPEWLSP